MKATDEMNVLEDEFDEIDPDEGEFLDDPDNELEEGVEEEEDYSDFYDQEDD